MSIAARRSHRGDEYQLAVAAYWVARLLWDDAIESVRVDAVALPGEGDPIHVDDIVIAYGDGRWRFIQAKKNQPNHSEWSLTDPVLCKELCKARDQLELKLTGRVEFCSRSPFGDLAKLLEDGADYPDHAAFAAIAPATIKGTLRRLAQVIDRDEPIALALLRRVEIGPHHDFAGWEDQTRALLESRVTDPETAFEVITKLVRSQQSGLQARGDALRRVDLLAALEERGVLPMGEGSEEEYVEAFAAASRIGRHWRRTIAGEPIARPELEQLIDWANNPETVTILLTDGPGTGKTCLLLDFADHVEQRTDWSLLFIKGDQFARCATEADLTVAGLPGDLVPRAARLARRRRVVVVIDSLDVLSLHREQRSLRLFLGLIERLERLANLCVVTACRSFDLRYDPLLRERQWDKTLTLEPLSFETVVAPLLARHGITSEDFSPDLKSLLAVPENLRLLVDSAVSGAAPSSIRILTSAYQLQALYLEEVVRRDPLLGDAAMTALQSLASRMMQERTLCLPRSAVATDEPRLQRLISQGVLAEPTAAATGQAIGFGHQTLLDALAVRAALAAGQSLAGFILAHPPFPFLRPAVRGFAMHLRATDPTAFRRQFRAALAEPEIAYHLKRVLIESLAELMPTSGDWPLIRHLWQTQVELFQRLLRQIRHDDWFRVLHEYWWPMLGDDSADDPVRRDFVARLDRWMNSHPAEVVALWQDAIKAEWGRRLHLERLVEIEFQHFTRWDTPGIEWLLSDLVNLRRESDRYLGKALSRFVEATGRGDSDLWRYICRDLELSEPHSPWRKLHCSSHEFHRREFLRERLSKSDNLLDLVIGGIDTWSRRASGYIGDTGLRYDLLDHTEWNRVYSRHSIRHQYDIEILLGALGDALRNRARTGALWWRLHEPQLRMHSDLGIRYLLLLAYQEDPEDNIEGIGAQLLDEALHRSDRLRLELGELATRCYPLLDAETQEEHQRLLLAQAAVPHAQDAHQWVLERAYRALLPIPAPFRSKQVLQFLDRWRPTFVDTPAAPDLYSWGGSVTPPVSVEQLLILSPPALRRLLAWYSIQRASRADLQGDYLVGGLDQLTTQLSDAAACAPARFLDLLPHLAEEDLHPSFEPAILRGAATHLMYRVGNLQSSSTHYRPEEPLPNGAVLAGRILWFLERYPVVWQDEWTVAQILQGCAASATGTDALEQLVWLLIRLARAKRPTEEGVRFDPKERTEVEAHDLFQDAINEPRGIAAVTALRLANRLIKDEDAWPDLFEPLLRRLASDPVASVRAGILGELPYLITQRPEVGWVLLDRCLEPSHPGLWSLAGESLYYQLRDHFGQVAPYLDRMLVAATMQADDTWARLSTLAVFDGHIHADDLLRTIAAQNRPGLWKGAVEVYSANIRVPELTAICRSGLMSLLDAARSNEILSALDWDFMKSVGFSGLDLGLAQKLIQYIDVASERNGLFGLPDWLAACARRAPQVALSLLEELASKLDGADSMDSLIDPDPLIAAMLEILREADDSDDPIMIRRAVALQDRFLGLGLDGMEEMLEKATAH